MDGEQKFWVCIWGKITAGIAVGVVCLAVGLMTSDHRDRESFRQAIEYGATAQQANDAVWGDMQNYTLAGQSR